MRRAPCHWSSLLSVSDFAAIQTFVSCIDLKRCSNASSCNTQKVARHYLRSLLVFSAKIPVLNCKLDRSTKISTSMLASSCQWHCTSASASQHALASLDQPISSALKLNSMLLLWKFYTRSTTDLKTTISASRLLSAPWRTQMELFQVPRESLSMQHLMHSHHLSQLQRLYVLGLLCSNAIKKSSSRHRFSYHVKRSSFPDPLLPIYNSTEN